MTGKGLPTRADERVGRRWFGWILAVLSTGLTLAIWSLLGPLGGQQGSLLIFAIPVTLAAWYGGPGPGLLATLLGALAEILFLSPPMRAPFPIDGAAVRVLLFGFSGTVISGLCGRLHRARGRAEAHEREARQAVARLEQTLARQSQTEEALRKAKEAAEVANQSKSDFLAHMTHELRTPLNGVIGMIDLLAQTPCSEQQRHYARVARSSADLLLSVINDILDFSKIEAGKLELERIDFSLPEAINEVHSLLAQRAADKGLELTADCDPRLSRPLCGDPARLRQVLINLVSNAIKFTQAGKVSLAVLLAPGEKVAGEDAVRVRFEVRDTGIGIGADAVPRLFQAFSQADSSTRRKYGGTGLGLAISKCLVERMDGMIGVESESGKGSLFWFVVRLGNAQCPIPNDQKPEIGHWSLGLGHSRPSGRILVVEDNLVNAEVAGEILGLAGYECARADNGRQAIEAVRQQSFDLILMDCQLPEMDGLEAARQIRALERAGRFCRQDGEPVPIIALTATATRQNREQCFAAGMNAYLSKPLDARRLLCLLDEHLGAPAAGNEKNRAEAEKGEAHSVFSTQYSVLSPANLAVARERMGGSAVLLAKLAGLFLAETHHVVERLRDAWKAEQAVELERLAHRLKGQAVTFEATAVGRLAAEVERLSKQGQLDPVGDLLPRLDDELAALGRQLQEVISH